MVESLSNVGYRTSKVEKYHQPAGQKPVDGLEILKGFLCPVLGDDGFQCHRAFLSQSTFARHLSDHPGSPGSKPDPPSCASYVQTLFSQGGLQKYFAVDPSLSRADPSSASTYACAVEMLQNIPQPNIPISDNDKDRASIHWLTRWPELLKPYTTNRESVDFLRSLVSFPDPSSDPDWLIKLHDHGSRWWRGAEAAHISCSWNVSIMLKSHEQ